MTTERRFSRRTPRLVAATAASAVALTLLAACGGSSSDSDSDATSGSTPSAGASKSGDTAAAVSTAIPTQDVVSAITADPAIKAELPAKLRDSGTITLGNTRAPGVTSLPHGGETSDGTPIGLDVDLRNAVAKVLGVTWKVEYGTFPTIIPGVQNGRYDVGMDNFGVTKAREEVVDFATYLSDGQSFLGSKDVSIDKVTALTDLCGLTVATSPGSTFQQILEDGAAKCGEAGKKPYKVQYFADTAPIFLGLQNGKVDIFFGPTLSLKYDEARVPGTKYLGQISTTPVGFVTEKGSPIAKALSDAVNKLIADGDYAKIFEKWGVPGTGIDKSEVNPAATF
ncbi:MULTISPECIES: ABC transporter substrate-binding protein [unclassified Streptomyces]|uniref:ABC transporter substrate-binding protein n=1 Tax=unclassified Streptomyces TaxID=2593676 RepID=UPI002E2ACFDA|nr:ABC transporter substrate-binding protein [Streptomyces sp. NBC_00223]